MHLKFFEFEKNLKKKMLEKIIGKKCNKKILKKMHLEVFELNLKKKCYKKLLKKNTFAYIFLFYQNLSKKCIVQY